MKSGCQGYIAFVGNKRIQPYLQVWKTSSEYFSRGLKRELKVNTVKNFVKGTWILRNICLTKNFKPLGSGISRIQIAGIVPVDNRT